VEARGGPSRQGSRGLRQRGPQEKPLLDTQLRRSSRRTRRQAEAQELPGRDPDLSSPSREG
jgi:hypothetical protein